MSDNEGQRLTYGAKNALTLGLLSVYAEVLRPQRSVYVAEDVHRLLADGIEVRGNIEDGFATNAASWAQNSALIIGIRPLKPETDERQLLRKFIDCQGDCKVGTPMWDAVNEARQLLARKEK